MFSFRKSGNLAQIRRMWLPNLSLENFHHEPVPFINVIKDEIGKSV
jgi:hypothetical protein